MASMTTTTTTSSEQQARAHNDANTTDLVFASQQQQQQQQQPGQQPQLVATPLILQQHHLRIRPYLPPPPPPIRPQTVSRNNILLFTPPPPPGPASPTVAVPFQPTPATTVLYAQSLQKRKLEDQATPDAMTPSSKLARRNEGHDYDGQGWVSHHQRLILLQQQGQQQQRRVVRETRWSRLPDAVLYGLFQFFDHRDLVRVIGAVCSRWRRVSRKNLLWRDSFHFQGFKVSSLAQALDLVELLFRNREHQGCAPITRFTLPPGCSGLVNASFSRLYRVCPLIETLELPQATSAALLEAAPNAGGTPSIRDRALKRIGKLQHLRRLDLRTHYDITDEGIVRYLVQKPAARTLEAIVLDQCVELTADSIVALLSNCPNLRTLSTIGCQRCFLSEQHLSTITNPSSTALLPAAHRADRKSLALEHLSVGLGSISESTFDRFLSIVPKLKTLNIWSWIGANASMLSQLFRRLQHLESLTVHFTENTELTLPVIESVSLRELVINTCVSYDRSLVRCPSLEKLHIQSIRELTGLNLECPALQTLRIRSCKVFDTNLSSLISSLSRLNTLEIVDCAGIPQLHICSASLININIFMCGDLAELVVRGDRMRSLTVESCMELLNADVQCPNLETSQWFCVPQMMFPRLERLLLSSQRLIAFNLLRCISLISISLSCDNLESLNLSDCRELRQLDLACPNLKRLALHAPKFDVSSTEAVDRLALRCPNLSMLSLVAMPSLTDDSLARICAHWRGLQGLMIVGCNALVTPTITLPSLRGLHLGECSSVSRVSLAGCTTLNKLILKGCPNLMDDTFTELDHTTPELKLLDVTQCRSLLRPFISNQSLNEVQFRQCASLIEPKLRCPNLRKLVFTVCDRLTGVRLTETPHSQLIAVGARQLLVGD